MVSKLPHGKHDPWYNSFWFRFLIGGIIIAGTTELAAFVSPKIGAIFWSLPFSLVPTFIYFWSIKFPHKKVVSFATDLVVSLVNLMAFVATTALSLQYLPLKGENAILYAMGLGGFVWLIGAIALYYLT